MTPLQAQVLRTLYRLKPNQGLTAVEGGFSAGAAASLLNNEIPYAGGALVRRNLESPRRWYLTRQGRAMAARLKAERPEPLHPDEIYVPAPAHRGDLPPLLGTAHIEHDDEVYTDAKNVGGGYVCTCTNFETAKLIARLLREHTRKG